MTPRLVTYATLASRGRGKWHAVDPHTGGPRCGVPLRRPHRAIAVTDGPWCGMCWGASELVKPVAQTFDTAAIRGRIASEKSDTEAAQTTPVSIPLNDAAESRTP